jgi:hypothetical protein
VALQGCLGNAALNQGLAGGIGGVAGAKEVARTFVSPAAGVGEQTHGAV